MSVHPYLIGYQYIFYSSYVLLLLLILHSSHLLLFGVVAVLFPLYVCSLAQIRKIPVIKKNHGHYLEVVPCGCSFDFNPMYPLFYIYNNNKAYQKPPCWCSKMRAFLPLFLSILIEYDTKIFTIYIICFLGTINPPLQSSTVIWWCCSTIPTICLFSSPNSENPCRQQTSWSISWSRPLWLQFLFQPHVSSILHI